jgi:amino acid adenylation domain-containing protein
MVGFADSCIRFASKTAIEWRDQRLSYRELDEKSTGLAGWLIASGVKRGDLIVVALENSFDVVPALLAIWKAGCVFVPIDVTNPEKRLSLMFSAVGPNWILTNAGLYQGKMLQFLSSDRLLVIEEGRAPEYIVSGDAIIEGDRALGPDDLSYLYFTSGSTGVPKAIAGRSKSVAQFIDWEATTFGVGEGFRVSQLTHPAFDAFLRDVFLPLSNGGTICVPDSREFMLDVKQLVQWIDQRGVQLIHCVPSLFRAILAQDLRPTFFENLRYVLLAGEALLPADIKKWMDIFDDRIELVNLYGATETTMVRFFHRITRADSERRLVPIGKPIDGTRALIVSPEGKVCPPHVAGEIIVRTPYASLGYYKDPDLTRQVFVPNPFNNDPNDLVYKTGDLGRMLPDGNFEFLGRMDLQVKIRGQRVELAEIDQALLASEGIQDAVTISVNEASGDTSLVAYVVTDRDLELQTLREHLSLHIPAAMMPATIMQLNSLPRTPNGKVDRKALPAPAKQRPTEITYHPPGTDIEKELASIWCELLGVASVGVKDDFFALGGHSLLATQLMARVRHAFEVEVPLAALLENPTIANLARVIEEKYIEEASEEEISRILNQPTRWAASVGGLTTLSGDDSRRAGGNPSHWYRGLSAEEVSKMAENLRKRKRLNLSRTVIPRISGTREVLPLSFAQKRLWFVHQFQPQSSFDNVPIAVRLWGPLDISALRSSLEKVIERHEGLRTNFSSVEGEPYAFLAKHGPVQLKTDFSLSEDTHQEIALQQAMIAEASLPFDLEKDQLIRARLFQLADQERVLLITLHHIVADGQSKQLIAQELATVYEAEIHGGKAVLPELPIQYADYAQWHNDLLQGKLLDSEISYWRERLKNAPSILELPYDHPVGLLNENHECRRYHFVLSQTLTQDLREIARREAVTLFVLLMSAYQVLLGRYATQDDIVTGTPISARPSLESERLIGFFLNILAIRTDLGGDPSFLDLLRKLRISAFGAYSHQNLPFEKLVQILQPQRISGQSPIFQTVFIFENDLAKSHSAGNLRFEALKFDKSDAFTPYHLTLYMADEEVLTAAIEYRTDLFEEATIERMASHFRRLLEDIASESRKRISELDLFDAASRKQIMAISDGGEGIYDTLNSLGTLFEHQARHNPNALAVIFENQKWTYAQLNRRANQLANYLRKHGLSAEGVVGIAIEPSAELLVALLGVLKAGGAYLPLDPTYPTERLVYMVKDSGASLVLVKEGRNQETGILPSLEGLDGITLLNVESSDIEKESGDSPAITVSTDNLAYVLYTSGSTGQPKGVMGTHRGAINRFTWMWQKYPFMPNEVCCQKTSLNFGDSVWEIFGPLLAGICLVIAPSDDAKKAGKLAEILKTHKVTRMVLVPTLLRAMLEEADPESLASVNLWTVSGEELPSDLAAQFHQLLPARTLLNLYGSSEVSADVSWCETGPQRSTERSCIGKPIANTRIYVLDAWMNPVPVGVKGEIYIAGAGLARGYFGRADLTAERFVPDPFAQDGGRLYRTGDKARYLPDGNLEYWGRNDQQVKIRGQRIELEEVSRVLEQHPAVDTAVVLAITEPDNSRYLAACVVPKQPATNASSTDVSADVLRRFAAAKLPRAMVPTKWKLIDNMPHLPSGKIDRNALSLMMTAALGPVTAPSDPPQGPVEETVARMWKEVLGQEEIGRTQNFFEIGGHSLLAVRVIAKIYNEFSVDVPLRDFFELGSVAALAQKIESKLLDSTDESRLDELLRAVESMDENLQQH